MKYAVFCRSFSYQLFSMKNLIARIQWDTENSDSKNSEFFSKNTFRIRKFRSRQNKSVGKFGVELRKIQVLYKQDNQKFIFVEF